jgi:hypothetical protein
MKTSTIIATLALVSSSAAALYFFQVSNSENSLRTDYENHVQQLLSQAEENSKQRFAQEREISELRSEVNTLTSQLRAASDQLNIAEAQSNPDYERLESEIRRQVAIEYEEDTAGTRSNQRIDLIRSIAQLDPMEFSEVMSLQGQFGPFLQALDVSDARMEEIVNALGNVIADQNQARQDIMQQAQSQEISRREVRTQMRDVMNPETMIETLSYDLTDQELNVLTEVQEQQRSQGVFGSSSISINDGNFSTPVPGLFLQGGSGTSAAQPLSPSRDPGNPRN